MELGDIVSLTAGLRLLRCQAFSFDQAINW